MKRHLILLAIIVEVALVPHFVCAENVIGDAVDIVVYGNAVHRYAANAPHSTVDLKPTLDDATLSVIKPNDQLAPNLFVQSKIENPLIYGTTLSPLDVNYSVIPASQAFEADIRDYFRRKYPKTANGIVGTGESSKIDITLVALSLRVRREDSGEYVIGGEIKLKVHINRNGKSISKKFIAVAETTGPAPTAKTMDPLYGHTVDQLINKVILLLDTYLSSNNL